MNDENELAAIEQADDPVTITSIIRTVSSFALYVAIDYWLFQSWLAVLLLVSVIVIHESGHFIAMKFFGYRYINITFIPLLGAYVSGTATNLSRKNKLIVLMAGPLPGIIIGCIFLYLYRLHHNHDYYMIAATFLMLNVFNLLPISPLDGGQYFQTLFLKTGNILLQVFLYLSAAWLIYLFFTMHNAWWLLIIAGMILMRIRTFHLVSRVRKQLDEEGFDYTCDYDDLTDEEYYQVRKALIQKSAILRRKYDIEEQSGDEQDVIRLVEKVLLPAFDDDLTAKTKILFTLAWIMAFVLPLLCNAVFKTP